MRIISKFHDYYDSVMGHGQDEECIYLRRTVEYGKKKGKDIPPVIKDIRDLIDKHAKNDKPTGWRIFNSGIDRIGVTHSKLYTYAWDTINLLFCGKLYKGISVTKRSWMDKAGMYHPDETSYFYSVETIVAHMEKEGIPDKSVDSYRWRKPILISALVSKYFSDVKQPDINWMIANKVICVLQKGDTITVNPVLREIQFYKVFDAYTTFQELDMWVSGTLAYPQNEMIEVADKYKIIGHGFDEKYGFRTRPVNYKGTGI